MSLRVDRTRSPAARRVQVILALLVGFVLVSRFLYLTSSTNLSLSARYVERVYSLIYRGVAPWDDLVWGQPIYSYLCGLVTALVSALHGSWEVWLGIRTTGILATASSVIPLFWIGRRLLGSDAGGLSAAAFYVVVPLTWWFSGEMMSDATGVALVLWAYGGLVRWWERGRPRILGLAALVLGAAPLIDFYAVQFVPFFLGLALAGGIRRGLKRTLFMLACTPVPLVATVLLRLVLEPGSSLVEPFRDLGLGAVLMQDLTGVAHWGNVGIMTRMALSNVGLWGVALGSVILLVCRPHAFSCLVLWSAPPLLTQLFVEQTAVRLYLPLMPVAAVALATPGVILARRPGLLRPMALFASGVVWTVMVLHARPDLITLHTRINVQDAIPHWYANHTPPDALLIAGQDYEHVRALGEGRETVRLDPRRDREPGFEARLQTPPALVHRIDTALLDGRPVYTNDWIDPVHQPCLALTALHSHYTLEPVGVLDPTNLRNMMDPDFGWMGEGLTLGRDIHVFRLSLKNVWPRAAPPPDVAFTMVDPTDQRTRRRAVKPWPGRGRPGRVLGPGPREDAERGAGSRTSPPRVAARRSARRGAASPARSAAEARLEPRLRVEVDCPLEPGARCRVWVSRSENALDWTHPSFGRDAWLTWSDQQGQAFETVLDVDGWGLVEIPLPPAWASRLDPDRTREGCDPAAADRPATAAGDPDRARDPSNRPAAAPADDDDDDDVPVAYVGYCVFDPDGNLRRIAVPCRVKRPVPGSEQP